MSEVKVGIEFSKEVILGVNAMTLLLIKAFKDGAQVTDIPVIINGCLMEPKIKTMFEDLFTKLPNIKAEFSDLDAQEIAELIVMEALFVPEVLKAIKGE